MEKVNLILFTFCSKNVYFGEDTFREMYIPGKVHFEKCTFWEVDISGNVPFETGVNYGKCSFWTWRKKGINLNRCFIPLGS